MSVLNTLKEGLYSIQCGDETYHLKARIDGSIMQAFELWLFQRELKSLLVMKETYTNQQYDKEVAQLRKDYKLGRFKWKSVNGTEALKDHEGWTFVFSKLMDLPHEEVLLILSQADLEEVNELFQAILVDSFPAEYKAVRNAAKKKGLTLNEYLATMKVNPPLSSDTDSSSMTGEELSSSINSTSDPGKSKPSPKEKSETSISTEETSTVVS